MQGSKDTDRDEGERPVRENAEDRAKVYEQTFDLPPETARLAAEDNVASGERKPASNDVDEARAAEARATDKPR